MRTPRYLAVTDAKHDRWLISYVDIVTILLILFVAVTAHALQRDPRLNPVLAKTMDEQKDSKPSQDLLDTAKKLRDKGVEVKVESRSLIISLPQTVLFASGQDEISDDAVPVISRIAEVISTIPNKVTLVGHADTTPIHGARFRDNWELSAARSLRLLEFLTTQFGVNEARLSVASQGSYNPRSPNDSPEGRAANRRVEIIIADATGDKPSPFQRAALD